MTKIRVDIESDKDIVSAKILLKHANGITEVEDIDTETEQQPTMKITATKKLKTETGVDPAFTETY